MIAAHLGDIETGAWPAETERQVAYLQSHGFVRAEDITQIIDGWMSGRYPATRSERARDSLEQLLPMVISELSRASEADAHFMGFAQFLEALPSGVQILTLLSHHPQLIKLITNFSLSAPSLMQELTKSPHIFEQMLDDGFFAPLQEHEPFDSAIAWAIKNKTLELQLDDLRRFAREAKFRAEAHILAYPDAAEEAHAYLSDLADSCLSASFEIATKEFEKKHGRIWQGEFAVLLLGRAGQKKLTPQSDIDVIFIYDGPPDILSDGQIPLSAGHYYQRLAMRLISWTSAKTASGILYDIDTRLRPDGQAGPVATHSDGWSQYLADKAWPFERLALQKARILGWDKTAPLHDKINKILSKLSTQDVDDEGLRDNVRLLRRKMAHNETAEWDLKKQAGGLLDCEFMHYLTGHMPALHSILNHLSLVSAVMMPNPHSKAHIPASFQTELCRIMAEPDFEAAQASLLAQRQEIASELEKLLAS